MSLNFSRRTWTIIKLALAATVAVVVVYHLRFAPTPVIGHELRLGPVVAEVMGTGTLEARVRTTISPRIQERLAEVLVDQNDRVEAGQLLARLDDGVLKLQVEEGEAALTAARATAERVRIDEARAQAVAEQARINHQRASELLATKVAAQADFDKAVEALQVSEADLKRARAAIGEAESQVLTAEKNLLYRREMLSYTRILSPYDGLVVRRDRDPGGVVVPGGSLLEIISTNEIWVSAWVDETASQSLSTGQLGRVVFRSAPSRCYPGELARFGRETDRETREFLVDVRVKELPPNWTVGQRAEVFIETATSSLALAAPPSFVHWHSGRPGVFVNDHGVARWHNVTLGLRGRDVVEIKQGATVGEQIVKQSAEQQRELREGQRITVR